MLHKKISVSSQVNKLSLPAKLLFTWMISHADDQGRLKGDPEYIKATVAPMTNWSFKRIKDYLGEMKNVGLIHHWQLNDELFIEFIKWNAHQSIRKDRFIPSDLPSNNDKNDNQLTTSIQPSDIPKTPQYNIDESNPKEFNKSEYKDNLTKPIADEKPSNRYEIINPKIYEPQSEGEVAAKEAWDKLEPYNLLAFQTTYLKALRRGLPPTLFYQFTSEIKQDTTIEKKGAVFNKKVDDYFTKKSSDV